MPFSSQREAKQFLVSKIIAEAAYQVAPLSDVERQLLLFTEQEPESMKGLPEEVLQDVDVEYEEKITALLRAAYKRDRDNPQEREQYTDAMRELEKGDHYILVMANAALPRSHIASAALPPPHTVRDLLLYVAIALGVVAAVIAFAMWRGAM